MQSKAKTKVKKQEKEEKKSKKIKPVKKEKPIIVKIKKEIKTSKQPEFKLKIKERKIQPYGWVPDIPDGRDYYVEKHMPELMISTELPPEVDLRAQCPTVIYDQGALGSCTANCVAAAVEFDQIKQVAEDYMPSRLFIYYCERVIERSVSYDSGAMLRDGMKSIAKQGAPHEKLWPYKISKFKTKPSHAAFTDGLIHQAIKYARVSHTLTGMKNVLAAGFPFVFGFSVYESFESATVMSSGNVPLPDLDKEQLLGGHAVLAVGYDENKRVFICRNSWGERWGDKGYFYMPYEYMENRDLVDDLWVVKLMESPGTP